MHDEHRSDNVRRFVESLREGEFRDFIVVPLLKAMGYKQVRVTHGPIEKGKDIVFEANTPIDGTYYCSVVVKAGKIRGAVNLSTSARNVFHQVEQSLDTPITLTDGRMHTINRVYVITNHSISTQAAESVAGKIKASRGLVRFIGIEELLELVGDYMPQLYTSPAIVASPHLRDLLGANYTMMSHMFGGPLNSILGIAEYLKRHHKRKSDDLIERKLSELIALCFWLDQISGSVQSYARLLYHKTTFHDERVLLFRDVLQKLMGVFEVLGRNTGVSIAVIGEIDIPPLMVDKRLMSNVFFNLFRNALEYCNSDGKITISSAKEKEFYRIDVSDYGLAIPAGEKEDIFSFGYRGSNAAEKNPAALGIGLYLCRAILNLYDGQIRVTKNFDPTTLSVLLPVKLAYRI